MKRHGIVKRNLVSDDRPESHRRARSIERASEASYIDWSREMSSQAKGAADEDLTIITPA